MAIAVTGYAADTSTTSAPPANAAATGLSKLGDPLAPEKMTLLAKEVVDGINGRSIQGDFLRFRSYLNGRLNATARGYAGSELTGICRLKWYEQMLRNPLRAPAVAERFTRELHQAILDPQEGPGLARVLATAREKMDLRERTIPALAGPRSGEEALDALKQALIAAQCSFQSALAPLAKSEINELRTNLYPVLVSQNIVGHTLNDRGTGRRLCDLLEKVDRDGLHRAAEALAPLVDHAFLAQLAAIPEEGYVQVPGVEGRVLRRIDTPAGAIIVGGRGRNVYHLDEMPDVAAVVDLGGNDEYIEGSVSLERPLLVILDLGGNNYYHGSQPGIQGSAVMGVSMLLNVDGNNVYEAHDVAQGSAICGVGILVDDSGSNRYRGVRRVQGTALCGLGILINRGGDNDYRAAMWGQGFGGPLGWGMLDDVGGHNHFFLGGLWRDSYPETPGYEGWGQGLGAGIRQCADGGLGILLDGAGDNVYEFDYLAHGGGYWCGMGFARDFGGNNKYLGSTETSYNGGARGEPQFQRFGCGFGCHYSLGFMFDDGGNSYYRGAIMGMGFGWDCSVGVLCNFGGNAKYDENSMTSQGCGAQASLGMLFDYGGDSNFMGYGQGFANPSISYHNLPTCGGNFSFLIHYGGTATYGSGAQNNSYNQRGSAGGFLIDRPLKDTTAETTAKRPAAEHTAAGL
jgi:hypothetical protein